MLKMKPSLIDTVEITWGPCALMAGAWIPFNFIRRIANISSFEQNGFENYKQFKPGTLLIASVKGSSGFSIAKANW